MPFVFDPILRQKNHSRMDDGIKAILAGESGSRYHLVDVRNRVIDEIHPFESLLTRPNLEFVKVCCELIVSTLLFYQIEP